MDPFATTGDLATYLKRTLTSAEEQVAELLLDGLSSAVREDCGQLITAAVSTVTLAGSGQRSLTLPQQPVKSVASVARNGTPMVTGGDYRVRNGQLYTWCGWPECDDFTVTFTHGYDDVPADVKLFVLMAAGEGMKGAVGLRSEQVGPFARSFLDSPPGEHLGLGLGDLVRRYSISAGVHVVRSGG